MDSLLWLLAAALLSAALLLVGFAVAALVHRQDFSPAEDLLIAIGSGIAVPALIALILSPTSIPYTTVCPPIAICLLAAAAGVLWRRRSWLRGVLADPTARLLLAGVGMMATLSLLLGALPWDWPGFVTDAGLVDSRHVPLMPGDSYLQYRTAQVIQNHLPPFETHFFVDWFISDRTPLVGLLTTFVASAVRFTFPVHILGERQQPYELLDPFGYWLYRLVSILTNSLALAPTGLIVHDLLGRRAARLGLIFSTLSPFILINVLFHWPKLLVGFFILGFFYWSEVRPRFVLAASFAAGAFYAHPLAILWVPGMLAYLLLKRRVRFAGLLSATLFTLLLPWFLWANVINHHPSRMVTYPIGYFIKDPTNANVEIAAAWQVFIHRPISSILNDHWVTIRDTFIDWPLLVKIAKARSLHGLRWPIYDLFRASFAGMFGLPLALWGFSSLRRIATSGFWFAALGAPTVITFLYWGIAPRAITIEGFQPGVALWIGLAAALLAVRDVRLARAIVALSMLEWFVFVFVFLLKVPSPSDWHASELALVVLSLLLVAAIAARGWRWAGERDE